MTAAKERSRTTPIRAGTERRVVEGRQVSRGNVTAGPWRGSAPDDVTLLERVLKKDADAFRALVDRHLVSVSAIARRILRDEIEADDVAQDVMLKLWRAHSDIDIGPGGLGPWLRRVTANLCIDRMRQTKRFPQTDEMPEIPIAARQQADLEDRDLAARVAASIEALPERQRLALTLFHHEGMSQAEIASLLDASEEAIESLLARARRTLKAELAAEWRSLHDTN